jgi:hypothetical protein
MSIQTVEAAPHIYRGECHENARCRRQAQHGPPRSNRSRVPTGSPSLQRIFTPDGLSISMAHLSGGSPVGITLTSRNVIAVGAIGERCALLSHQLKVASGTPYLRENALRVRPLRRNCSTICSRSAGTAGRNGFGDFRIPIHPAYPISPARCRCTPLTAYGREWVTCNAVADNDEWYRQVNRKLGLGGSSFGGARSIAEASDCSTKRLS